MALESAFSRKLSAFVGLSGAECAVVSDIERRSRRFPAKHTMMHQGQSGQSACILARGWASSYKILPSGARAVVGIQIPGDFLGLRSILFSSSDQGIDSVTPVEVSAVTQSLLTETFFPGRRVWRRHSNRRPLATRRLSRSIWWAWSGATPPSGWRISCWNRRRG